MTVELTAQEAKSQALGLFYTPTEEDKQRLFRALSDEGLIVTYLDIESLDRWPRADGFPARQKLVVRYVCSRSYTQVKSRTLRALRKAKLQMADWVRMRGSDIYVLTVKGQT